ncbi:MAG: hypothetical protein IJ480_08810 [Clostridia bacterium]|nr:hypothetical protein [Clostridia bacterium]
MGIACLLGVCLAYVNYRLTGKAARSSGSALSLIPVVRMFLSVGYLAAVYFLAPYTPWDRIWMLAGAVAGLTVPMFFFTFLLLRQISPTGTPKETDNHIHNDTSKGGDA